MERNYQYNIGDKVVIRKNVIPGNSRLALVNRFNPIITLGTAIITKRYPGNGISDVIYYVIDFGDNRWIEVTEKQIKLYIPAKLTVLADEQDLTFYRKDKRIYSYTIRECPGYEGYTPNNLSHEVCKHCGNIAYYHYTHITISDETTSS